MKKSKIAIVILLVAAIYVISTTDTNKLNLHNEYSIAETEADNENQDNKIKNEIDVVLDYIEKTKAGRQIKKVANDLTTKLLGAIAMDSKSE